jgi:hypothetical protein
MTGEQAPAHGSGTEGEAPPPAFDISHPALDTSVAHQARVYDYYLGGYFLYTHTASETRVRQLASIRASQAPELPQRHLGC